MHLNRFISKREQTWRQLQDILARVEGKGLKHLSEGELVDFIKLYRQASSDLHYLNTHFKESRHASYLNSLLSRCHTCINIQENNIQTKVKFFFVHGFPSLLQREKYLFLTAAAIFLITFTIAFLSIYLDAPWADELISPDMRALLEENATRLEEGKTTIPGTMQPLFTSRIVTNNIQVGFTAFAGGIVFGLGTILILAVNGLLLGSFAAVFTLHGRSLLFWAHILPHGVIELSAIFIVAAGGLMLGRALLMPGDYTRKDALRRDGRAAAFLLCGTIPLFAVAAAIEGFLTPSALAAPVKLIFAGLTAVALAYYLLLLPLRNKNTGIG